MRFIDKMISFVFNVVIIMIAVVVILVMTNCIEYSAVNTILTNYVFNFDYKDTIILTSVIVLLLGLKITVFSSSLTSKAKKNILVNTNNGKIQIAQETIEGIAKNVIREHSEIKDVQAKMAKFKKGINMYMIITVLENTNMRNIVEEVQSKVKEQIEKTTSVHVYDVDVKIKNVVIASGEVKDKKMPNKVNVNEEVPTEKKASSETSTQTVTKTKEEAVIKSSGDTEYKVDENNILYKVEPNVGVEKNDTEEPEVKE